MKIALALGNTEWEAEFVSVLAHPMLNLKVVRRCVDGIDLLAAVKVNEIEIVVVTDATLRIDGDSISLLHESGVVVVAISNFVNQWNDLGVQNVITFDDSDLFAVASKLTKVGAQSESISPNDSSTKNSLVCVASFGGGVGRTLITKELGWWNSTRNLLTVIVEGDVFGASLLQEFNLPPLTKDLLQLSQARVSPPLSEYDLTELAVVEPNLVVVPGLAHTSLWPALRRTQIEKMWTQLNNSADVIVDVGPVFCSFENAEHEINFSYRELVAQSAITKANAVVLCAMANIVSVTRLIRGVIDNQDELRNQEIFVVLNRVRGSKSAKELSQLIKRHTGIQQIICLPDDPDVLERAQLKCEFLGKLQAKHEISGRLAELSKQVFNAEREPTTQIQELRLQRATAA